MNLSHALLQVSVLCCLSVAHCQDGGNATIASPASKSVKTSLRGAASGAVASEAKTLFNAATPSPRLLGATSSFLEPQVGTIESESKTPAKYIRKHLRGGARLPSQPLSKTLLEQVEIMETVAQTTFLQPQARPVVEAIEQPSSAAIVELPGSRSAGLKNLVSAPIVLTGSMRVDVADPETFLSDDAIHKAVAEGIADILGIHPECISLKASWSGSMLLASFDERVSHMDRSVDVDITITLGQHLVVAPESLAYMFNMLPSEEISTAIQGELSALGESRHALKVLKHSIAW